MAKHQQTGITFESHLVSLLASVWMDGLPMSEARLALRDWASTLTPEQRAAFNETARDKGRKLQTIAEAFSQELTVMGAGQ